jgi:rhodanese-related sulfurtransferase
MYIQIILFFLIIFPFDSLAYYEIDNKEISVQEAKVFFDNKNKLFVDCRTVLEYKNGHIPGALLIQNDFVEKYMTQKIAKETQMIVYCRTQTRSRSMKRKLNNLGYHSVWVMNGGWQEWMRSGYPFEKPQ